MVLVTTPMRQNISGAGIDAVPGFPRAAQTGDGDMKLRSISLAMAACCWVLPGIVPAQAGYWNYGCKGNLADKDNGNLGDSVIVFDRFTLVIVPAGVAHGDIAGLAKGEIRAFDAERDEDLDFKPSMKFARAAYPDQTIVLTEKSSKEISKQSGHLGSRETFTARYRKAYHYQRKGWQYELPEADIVMDCFETHITAP
jgi:hypothetical protein